MRATSTPTAAFQMLSGRQRNASAEIAELVETSDSYNALSQQALSKRHARGWRERKATTPADLES